MRATTDLITTGQDATRPDRVLKARPTVVAYLRCATSIDSFDEQRAAVASWARRRGLKLRVHQDGASGRSMERPDLQALISAAAEGSVDRVVLTDMAQLSPDPAEISRLRADWAVRGVEGPQHLGPPSPVAAHPGRRGGLYGSWTPCPALV